MPQPTITGILIDPDAIGTVPGQGLYGAVDFVFQDDGGTQDSEEPGITHGGSIDVYVEVPDTQTGEQMPTGSAPTGSAPTGSQEDPCPPPTSSAGAPPAPGPTAPSQPPATGSTNNFGWYSDDCNECCNPITDRIINYLDLKVATFTSPAYSPRLAASCDPDPIVKEAVARGHAVVRTIDLKTHMAGTLSRVPTKRRKDGAKVYKFRYGASFPKPNGPLNHLEVVSYLNIDHDRLAEDFDINTFGESQKRAIPEIMNFKTSIEKVITNGKVVEDSYVFVDAETGENWDGPYHYHRSSGFMAGERHTPTYHAKLKPKKVSNIKIKNRSIKSELLNLDFSRIFKSTQSDTVVKNLKSSTNEDRFLKSFVSEPIESRTSDGQTRFLFYVDQKRLVKNLSRFPGFAEDTIYDSASLKNISIYRRRGTENKNKNEFGISKASDDTIENHTARKDLIVSTSDESSSLLSATKNRLIRKTRVSNRDDRVEKYQIGSIEEINVHALGRYRVFSVADAEIADLHQGKYQYSVEMKFEDPTIIYLNQKLNNMCMAKDALQEIHYISSLSKNYNTVSDTFSDKYKYETGPKHIDVLQTALVEIVEFLTMAIGRPPRRFINYFLSEASAQTGSPQGIQNIIDIMNSFERKIMRLLGKNIRYDRLYGAKSANKTKIFSKERSSKGMLDFEKDFDFIVDRSARDRFGVDYVRATVRSFPGMSASEYRARQRLEMQKYFSTTSPATAQNTVNKNIENQATRRAITSLENSYGFLTPASINVGDETLILIDENSEIDNIEKQNQIVSKIVQKNSSDSKTYFEKEDDFSMSLDTLAAIGVSAYTEQDKRERENRLKDKNDEGYTQSTKSIFGDRSFGDKNIDKIIEQGDHTEDDDFVVSATNKTAVSINDKLAQTGILTGDAPINQDQEINIRNPKDDFLDKLSIKQFDLNNENNIVKKLGARRVSNLPPSIKSLFVSREQGTRNWLDFEKDLIQDPELKNIYRLNHSNVVKLEYLEKVTSSRFGPSTKNLVYKPLTRAALNRAPLLVRCTPVFMPEVGIGTDSGIETEMYTENFLIGGAAATGGPRRSRANIAARKARITNYIVGEMNRLTFEETSEMSTHLNTNC